MINFGGQNLFPLVVGLHDFILSVGWVVGFFLGYGFTGKNKTQAETYTKYLKHAIVLIMRYSFEERTPMGGFCSRMRKYFVCSPVPFG
jgi:hypothetical protein